MKKQMFWQINKSQNYLIHLPNKKIIKINILKNIMKLMKKLKNKILRVVKLFKSLQKDQFSEFLQGIFKNLTMKTMMKKSNKFIKIFL